MISSAELIPWMWAEVLASSHFSFFSISSQETEVLAQETVVLAQQTVSVVLAQQTVVLAKLS